MASTTLRNVIVTDRFMSPFNKMHQKFELVPPGEHPMTNNPNLYKGSSNKAYPNPYDSCGIRIGNMMTDLEKLFHLSASITNGIATN